MRIRPFGSLAGATITILLAFLLTACEGGYVVRGEWVKESHSGDRGEIDVRINSANGSVRKSVELDNSTGIVDVEVTLKVEKGAFKIELLGDEDEVTLVLEAGSGQKPSGSGHMVTDGFGGGEYRVTAVEAKRVAYHILCRVRR